jgi:protein-tyrosine-phosphatase
MSGRQVVMQNITAPVIAWYVSLSARSSSASSAALEAMSAAGIAGTGHRAALMEAVHDRVDVVLQVHVDALSLELKLSPKKFLQVGLVGDAKS